MVGRLIRRPCLFVALSLAGLSLLLATVGCAEYMRTKQLERVAKDWCTTIRASQVIPVYPLTEDLKVGDVFLVQLPTQEQERQYKKKGFLPLDMQLGRIDMDAYGRMYQGSHGVGDLGPDAPFHWPLPGETGQPGTPQPTTQPADSGESETTSRRHTAHYTEWWKAPHAAFPTYTFDVNLASGLNIALPIKGIPVAMGLLHAEKATGSVVLDDAYSYGLPLDEIDDSVQDWAETHRGELQTLAASARTRPWFLCEAQRQPLFLRVISRVYLVGRVEVSLAVGKQGAGGISFGQTGDAGQAALPTPTTQPTAETNLQLVESLNEMLNATPDAPAGRFRFVWASARTVGLEETFERPLVVGYLGFDYPIDPETGQLGPPIAIRGQLPNKLDWDAHVGQDWADLTSQQKRRKVLVDHIRTLPSADQERVYGQAAKLATKEAGPLFLTLYNEKLTQLPPSEGGYSRPLAAWDYAAEKTDLRSEQRYRLLWNAYQEVFPTNNETAPTLPGESSP